jgi:hypothetical protein
MLTCGLVVAGAAFDNVVPCHIITLICTSDIRLVILSSPVRQDTKHAGSSSANTL